MAISLTKGANVNLSKESPGLKQVLLGLGWDARTSDGLPFDLDASLFMLGALGKVRSDSDFIFYGQLKSSCGSVIHFGDNLDGGGDGDDEVIRVNLPEIPNDVNKLVVVVTIHEAESRKQSFGQVNNAFMRIVNNENQVEVVRFDLSEDYSTETAMIFGEIYRWNNEWKFKAVGQGYSGGLKALAVQYGVNID